MKLLGTALGARVMTTALITMTIFGAATAIASAQDAGKGEKIFNQCQACHALDKAMVGPGLAGVVGRKAGSYAGYSYSPLMKAAGEAGLTWTDAALVDYLNNPTEYLKKYVADKGKEASGASKMSFKLGSEQQRKDVVAYLAGQKG